MQTFTDLTFLIALAFFLNHELDAIQNHEWRFFFAFTPLNDQQAYRWFTALHIPLWLLILWNIGVPGVQIALDVVLILHAGVHLLLRNHPKLSFNNWFSRVWIFGGALFGLLHLILLQRV